MGAQVGLGPGNEGDPGHGENEAQRGVLAEPFDPRHPRQDGDHDRGEAEDERRTRG